MKKYFFSFLAGTGILIQFVPGCRPAEQQPQTPIFNGDGQSILGLVYQQQAAEYRALCFQGYNLARKKVEESVRLRKKNDLPLAVITDLDETALDNSAYDVYLYQHDSTYSRGSWENWCNAAVADSVPGSVSFFNFVNTKKIDIYYVSNREMKTLDTTIYNMRKLGFPELDRNHFYFRASESSKEKRRLEIAKTHKIIVLLGDNLIDLDARFDKASTSERRKETDSLKEYFGDRYIVFPNAVYGDWETALYYDYQRTHKGEALNLAIKDSIRLSVLHGY